MAKEPLKKELNRAEQLKRNKSTIRGIRIYDIDLAIAEHMIDSVVPNIEVFGESVKVPVIYGNPERWKSVRKDGYFRDSKGQIQIPLIMFKRNSISRDDSIPSTMNRHLFYPSVTKYSPKHRYDRFSLMSAASKPLEQYNITIPDYITISYECIIWTDFTEHMNKIVEAFQYATDEYWGDKYGYKFRVRIDNFDTTSEVAQGSQRLVKTSFTMLVHAYLLPEEFNNKPTTEKSITPKKVVWSYELDMANENGLGPDASFYNEYSDIVDFMTIRGSDIGSYIDDTSMKLVNVKLPKIPPALIGSFNEDDWFRVYINGVFITPSLYSYNYNPTLNEITFTFDTNNLGYTLSVSDEFGVTGKFIEL